MCLFVYTKTIDSIQALPDFVFLERCVLDLIEQGFKAELNRCEA